MRSLVLAALLVAGCSSNTETPIGRPGDDVASSTPVPVVSAPSSAAAISAPPMPCIRMPAPRHMPEKRAGMVELVETEWLAVFVDPHAKGVKLPPYLHDAAYVVLDIGQEMPVPVKDLQFSDSGFDAELVFHGKPFRVRVPYAAVFGYVSHTTQKGGLYADEIPKDALCDVAPPP